MNFNTYIRMLEKNHLRYKKSGDRKYLIRMAKIVRRYYGNKKWF